VFSKKSDHPATQFTE